MVPTFTHSIVNRRVTSSEKVDKENRYSEFILSSIPYPGCEFFRTWKDRGYQAEGLVFDWNQVFTSTCDSTHP